MRRVKDIISVTKKEKYLNSLYLFSRDCCGLSDLTNFLHRKICVEIQDTLTCGKRIAVIIPRDHFKSSIGSAACLWMFLTQFDKGNMDYSILIDTATTTLAFKHVSWITRQFKGSADMRTAFGDFVPEDRTTGFNAKEITVRQKRDNASITREANFTASSIRSEATGLHFDMIWYDDLIGEKNYYSKIQRQKAIDHYKYSLSMLKPGGTILYTATRWHDGDLTGVLLREEAERKDLGLDQNFKFIIKAAIEEGQPIFPERFPIEKLNKMKSEMPRFQWHSQYMNDPVIPEESLPFDRGSLYRSLIEFPQLRGLYVTVDPNFRHEQKAGGDYAAFVVGGFDRFMNWWGKDVRLARPTATEFIDILFDINQKWKPSLFRIEKSFTSFLDVAIRTESSRRGVYLPITYIERSRVTSKQSRMAELDPVFRNRRIHFSDAIPAEIRREMEEELERGDASAHDDFRDALADQFIGITPSVLAGAVAEEEKANAPGADLPLPHDFGGYIAADLPDEVFEGDEWS